MNNENSRFKNTFIHFKTIQVVQEYERAVIFRLGRLLAGGSRGPGKYIVIVCISIVEFEGSFME